MNVSSVIFFQGQEKKDGRLKPGRLSRRLFKIVSARLFFPSNPFQLLRTQIILVNIEKRYIIRAVDFHFA